MCSGTSLVSVRKRKRRRCYGRHRDIAVVAGHKYIADILRMKNGALLEHWDVIQDEGNKAELKSGLSMFGKTFAK